MRKKCRSYEDEYGFCIHECGDDCPHIAKGDRMTKPKELKGLQKDSNKFQVMWSTEFPGKAIEIHYKKLKPIVLSVPVSLGTLNCLYSQIAGKGIAEGE